MPRRTDPVDIDALVAWSDEKFPPPELTPDPEPDPKLAGWPDDPEADPEAARAVMRRNGDL